MPSQQKQFEYLEHTADIKFLTYGKTLEEVFENAALAMIYSQSNSIASARVST